MFNKKMARIIGIFSYPWNKEFTEKAHCWSSLFNLYRKAVWYKANPRTEEYMRKLFFEKHPDGIFINADNEKEWNEKISSVDTIFLLYPDSIGLGFSRIEKNILSCVKDNSSIYVLNGRRRELLLDASTRRKICMRRFFEQWMVGEMCAVPLFIVITPVLLLIDWMRGRF